MNRRIQIGALDALGELLDQTARDPVAALGTVERYPGDAVRGDIAHGSQLVHRAVPHPV